MAAARRLRRGTRRRAILLAALAILLTTGLRALDLPFVTAIREYTFDAYQRAAPRPYQDLPVRIVDIDEASIAALGQWPWSRIRLAALTERLAALGAAVIAYDVIFSEPDRTAPTRIVAELPLDAATRSRVLEDLKDIPDGDTAFATALARAPAVLGFGVHQGPPAGDLQGKAGFAFTGVDPLAILPAFRGYAAPIPPLAGAARGIGSVGISERDSFGVIRRIPFLWSDGRRLHPSLAIEALRVAQGASGFVVRGTGASGEADTGRPALTGLRVGEFTAPLTREGEFWIRYDRDRPERYVPAKDVLDEAREAELRPRLEGHIVFVGTSAVGLRDVRASPLGEQIPGVLVHAQAVEQIISGAFLTRPDWADGAEVLLVAALGGLVVLLAILFGGPLAAVAGVAATAGAFLFSWYSFKAHGLLIDPLFPALGAAATFATVTTALYVLGERERRFVRTAFGQYLAPALLAKLERTPDAMRLGGEIRHMSVLFMDVRDFTPISEALGAEDLVHFLNALLTPLSDAIQDHEGTIDKYIGDSIMAFWNAPVAVEDHAAKACRAALAMRRCLAELDLQDAFGLRARGRGDIAVRIGIGINTGEVCVGNMGSARRFNYSVVGDAVNTAARIESTTKAFSIDILVSEHTAAEAPGFGYLEAGAIPLKGKSRPERLFALVCGEEEARQPSFQGLAAAHAALLAAVEAGDAARIESARLACRELAPEWLVPFFDHFNSEAPAATAA